MLDLSGEHLVPPASSTVRTSTSPHHDTSYPHHLLTMRPAILIPSTITRTLLNSKHTPRKPRVSFLFLGTAASTRSIANMSSASPQPNFSSNYDPAQATQDLSPLLKGNGGRWELIETGKGVERGFRFKTFKKTWVSAICTIFRFFEHLSYISRNRGFERRGGGGMN
jgi:hypothetical protein